MLNNIRLKFFEKKASFIGIKFLFALPKRITQEQDVKKFKKLLTLDVAKGP